MADRSIFRYAYIYQVTACCATPLHVGSANGEAGEILIHPVTRKPFIQASGIAGACRDYAETYLNIDSELWFGEPKKKKPDKKPARQDVEKINEFKNPYDSRSRLVFTDGEFADNLKMELRTRVNIDRITGTTASENNSGQLLQTEYISKGTGVTFSIYEFFKDQSEVAEGNIVERILSAMDKGNILLGGQLSNGCGCLQLQKVERIACDMTKPKGRRAWIDPEQAPKMSILSDIRKKKEKQVGYRDFEMTMTFDQAVLVKGNLVDQDVLEEMTHTQFKDGVRLPDKMQLMDGNKKFIIPGSSFKGVFRNNMTSILEYLKEAKEAEELVDNAFEKRSKVFFYDTEIGEQMSVQVRTHLDKFTGSVMDKALFKEAVNGGKASEATLRVRLMKTNDILDAQLSALIILTMRDCAVGMVTVGSGYNVGRGFMNVKCIQVTDNGDELMSYSPKSGVKDSNNFVQNCLQSLQ